MSIPEQRYAVPSRPTVQRKMDLVDREGLEDVDCDLDYVPPVGFPEHPGRSIFIASFTVATTSTALTWAIADFTGDGVVDVSDLGILATNYGTSSSSVAVPAPSILAALAGLALAGLAIRHRGGNGSL